MLPFFFLLPYGAYALHNKDDEETENSESKSKKLKSTWGFHAGNSYATSDSSICKYCESVKTHVVQNWNHCFINVNKFHHFTFIFTTQKSTVFYPTLSCYNTPQSKLEQFITVGVIAGRQF